jgi:hypothetical protein
MANLADLPAAIEKAVTDGTAAVAPIKAVITDVEADIKTPEDLITLSGQQFADLKAGYTAITTVLTDLEAVKADL